MRLPIVVVSIFALCFLSLFAEAASAESVFVQNPQAEGEEIGLRSTVLELVKAAVSEQAGYSLANSEASADLTLRTRILKLGSAYLLTVDKIKNGKILFTSKMRASSAEDLDTVSSRVVRSALKEVKAETNAQVDDVTEDEVTRGSRRHIATRQWSFGFGPSWGQGLNSKNSGFMFNLGFVYGVDPLWDLHLSWRGTTMNGQQSHDASFSEFMLGTNYHFSKEKNAPFVTAAVGRGSAVASSDGSSGGLIFLSEDSASGWAIRGGLGMKFFRVSTVNLGVEATYTQMLAKTSVSQKHPGVFGVLLNLYY